MKIPKDKLPLKVHGIGKKQYYGQYTINRPGGYAGRIVSKDLSQYVVKAANEFPEAIGLLERLLENNMCSVIGDELIEEYLNKLEDEKA